MNSSSRGSSPFVATLSFPHRFPSDISRFVISSADEDEERRDFRSIIAADRRFRRSSSSSSSSNDDEEGPRESALITLIYHGDDDDEILVLNRRRIAFKGCLQRQGETNFLLVRRRAVSTRSKITSASKSVATSNST